MLKIQEIGSGHLKLDIATISKHVGYFFFQYIV